MRGHDQAAVPDGVERAARAAPEAPEVLRGAALQRAPAATANSDLNKLQRALLDLDENNGTKPGKVKLSRDGSVIVLIARSKEVSARLVAEHLLSNRQKTNPVVLTGNSGMRLDEALEGVDEARCGFENASNWRPVLQIMPLALNLIWEPLDPYLLLQFLNHPVGPMPKRFRARLAASVLEAPGIGGRSWQWASCRPSTAT